MKRIIFFVLILVTALNCKTVKMKVLELIYQYYPKGVEVNSIEYDMHSAKLVLDSILLDPPYKVEAEEILSFLKITYGVDNVQDLSLFAWRNPSYHFRIHTKDDQEDQLTIILFISVISDFFYLYRQNDLWKSDSLGDTEVTIRDKIRMTLPAYKQLDPSLAKVVVPDLSFEHLDFGEVKVLNCLFTDHIY